MLILVLNNCFSYAEDKRKRCLLLLIQSECVICNYALTISISELYHNCLVQFPTSCLLHLLE